MRSFVKVLSSSMLAVLVGCSGASEPGPVGSEGAPQPEPGQPSVESSNAGNVVGRTDEETSRINSLIASAGHLTTDKQADLDPVQKGETKQETVQGEAGSYYCKTTDYSLTKVPEKFVALNPNADVLWPGSIVQGKSMAGGILDPVPVKRAPGTITLTIASGGSGVYHQQMERPSLSAAMEAQNAILATYEGATPAKFSYAFQSIYSSEQLAVAVDANVKGTNWAAAASLSVDKKDEKSRFLIQFTQEYFTMAFDPPQGAAGVFDPSVTSKDLEPYAQNGNPPVYVASVTYGRIFYILFESTASQLDLEAAVSGSYSGSVSVDASVAAKYKTMINESTVKAYGLGGSAEMAIDAVSGSTTDQFERIQKFLTTGANFDKKNPGVPISYTIRHLTDASQVKLALTTEYTAKDCAPTKDFCDDQGHKLDSCGVCGGNDTTCDPCPAQTIQRKEGGSYVNFNAGAASHGSVAVFPDGSYYKYANAYCNQIQWGNVRLTCRDGNWVMTSGSTKKDILCSDNNNSWSGSGNSISTGWQP
ncbi:MAG TPA: thiol-activated cytolysin family protein [Labilithrix sp.]|nr:thiol-activated cytolysin family protein [Labilithrix sp.]